MPSSGPNFALNDAVWAEQLPSKPGGPDPVYCIEDNRRFQVPVEQLDTQNSHPDNRFSGEGEGYLVMCFAPLPNVLLDLQNV